MGADEGGCWWGRWDWWEDEEEAFFGVMVLLRYLHVHFWVSGWLSRGKMPGFFFPVLEFWFFGR